MFNNAQIAISKQSLQYYFEASAVYSGHINIRNVILLLRCVLAKTIYHTYIDATPSHIAFALPKVFYKIINKSLRDEEIQLRNFECWNV